MPQPQGGTAGSLLLVDVLLYDRAKLLVGEPLLGVNLVGVLAGYLEELFVVVGLKVVALQGTLHRSHLYITPFPYATHRSAQAHCSERCVDSATSENTPSTRLGE
jgi:hypothetical protein